MYFVGLMASLGALLSYGAYLAYSLLTETIKANSITRAGLFWKEGSAWSQVFQKWAWAFAGDVRIGAVGMLALLTAPLASGLFWYHTYLIWAGMTTNETSKWADWRDDITDGLVFRSDRASSGPTSREAATDVEPYVDWPIVSKQQLVSSDDGQPPKSQPAKTPVNYQPPDMSDVNSQQQDWRRVQNLSEVDNLYDLGFLDNFRDIFPRFQNGSSLSNFQTSSFTH